MILVTVGTEKFPFNRLMQWMDHLIQEGFIDPKEEEVIIQYGSCTFIPTGVTSYSLLPSTEFSNYVQQARLIIAHCGEGTIDLLGKMNKPFILVPRSYRFGEHVDEHQLELAEMMEKRGVVIARSPGDLVRFIAAPKTVQLSITPADYYAFSCKSLEAQLREKTTNKAKSGYQSGMFINQLFHNLIETNYSSLKGMATIRKSFSKTH